MSLITGNESKIFAEGVVGNVRSAQEDSHGYQTATPNGDLFVVCDGMGGHVGGAMASSLAVDSIIGYLLQQHYPDPIAALDGALQFANRQILDYAEQHPEFRGMGTTACIVLVRDNDVWIAHVGDSRIYLYLGAEQQLHRITKDHSFVQALVDAGQITDDMAEHHPQKNRILRALGVKDDMQPTFNYQNLPIHPKNGDIFLICSDGLSGMIPDSTIERVLSESSTLEERGKKLIDLAMQGETVQPGGQDNCTVELIEVDNSPWNKSEFTSYNPEQRQITQEGDDEPPTEEEIQYGGHPMDACSDAARPLGALKRDKRRMSPSAIAAIAVAGLILLTTLWIVIDNQRPSRRMARLEQRVVADSTDLAEKQKALDSSRVKMQASRAALYGNDKEENTDSLSSQFGTDTILYNKDSLAFIKSQKRYGEDTAKLHRIQVKMNNNDNVSGKKEREKKIRKVVVKKVKEQTENTEQAVQEQTNSNKDASQKSDNNRQAGGQ